MEPEELKAGKGESAEFYIALALLHLIYRIQGTKKIK
jgi:hypothetical protein